ncbi:hypothetical protein DU500_14385 [Haloplanus rubicundus]|uniref:Uncharacterized protein n=1 Tax=Haloplanus rubicundus TaxID=1547898 RepID=A0A345EFG1_9EURY|nr:DUF5794 domain-containing protein [Haloplanus rubicundus]AXG07517.1 hypothetical protein DU500_14385 [Haloplanus rubicundus]AXG10933.1 hypothetical protein DU484_14355 [Haloplanus rubicundus]
MSVSQHPVALRLERQVGGATKLLATVMALPLIDGIFPALILAGALTYPFGILEAGLLIFGGSATVAVVLAEMDGSPRERMRAIALLGVVLLPAAAIEAALAPTVQTVIDMAVFQRFAGLVILTVAAKTASARVGEYLPRPAVIIGLGLVASLQPAGASVTFVTDSGLVLRGVAAAGVGVGFAMLVAALGPVLQESVDLDLFRFGSAVALGMLALSVLGLMPTEAPVALGVLCVTAVFSYDPDAASAAEADGDVDQDGDAADASDEDDAPATADDDARPSPFPIEDESRAPWL